MIFQKRWWRIDDDHHHNDNDQDDDDDDGYGNGSLMKLNNESIRKVADPYCDQSCDDLDDETSWL